MSLSVTPISPVAFSIFGLPVRWYALAYIVAFIFGYLLFKRLTHRTDSQIKFDSKQLDDLLTYIILGVIIGGRLGYVLVYNLPFFISHPLEIFAVWHGGMSFHGGLIGVIIATFLFSHNLHCKKHSLPDSTLNTGFKILDILAVVTPVGLFFGRIANFINMEVMGRPTSAPWGIVFDGDTITVPRHPSPLYEAVTEGFLLFIVMYYLYRFTKLKQYTGALSGAFAIMYAGARIFCEQFRAPDAQIGFLTNWGLTMGQLLSFLLFISGVIILCATIKNVRKTQPS